MKLLEFSEGYRLYYVALLVALALLAAAGSTVTASLVNILSTSPLNDFITGSSSFYHELGSLGYHVVLGGPQDVKTLVDKGRCVIYLLIGPDKPLNDSEARLLASLYSKGLQGILVADETGGANRLLELLGVPTVDGLVTSSAGGENSYIVPLRCFNTTLVSSKVAVLNRVGKGKVVCQAYTGKAWLPVAAYYEGKKSRLLVIGDSSVFANFEFNGLYGFPSTRTTALKLVELVAPRSCVVVYDNTHYNMVRIRVGRILLRAGQLVLTVPTAISSLLLGIEPPASLAAIIAAAILVALYLLGLPWTPRPSRREAEMYEHNTSQVLAELALANEGKKRHA